MVWSVHDGVQSLYSTEASRAIQTPVWSMPGNWSLFYFLSGSCVYICMYITCSYLYKFLVIVVFRIAAWSIVMLFCIIFMKVISDRMLILERCCGILVSNTLVCSLEVGISYIEFDRQFMKVDFTGLMCGQISVPLLSLEQLTFPFWGWLSLLCVHS